MDLTPASQLSRDELIRGLSTVFAPIQDELIPQEIVEPTPIFIIGLPRAGTTVTYQLLANTDSAGYISNFLARFWETPVLGAVLEKGVRIRQGNRPDSFESSLGRTPGWNEPHEFGYFWDRWFGGLAGSHNVPADKLEDLCANDLRREITSLELFWEKPVAFANNTWCTLQAAWLSQVFPEAVFVVCRRDPLYIAQSLYSARIDRHGDPNEWWSVKPRNYGELKSLPWPDQIAGQVRGLMDDMDNQISKIDDDRIISSQYAEFCRRPEGLVDRLDDLIALPGFDTQELSSDVVCKIENRNSRKIQPDAFQKLERAVSERVGIHGASTD